MQKTRRNGNSRRTSGGGIRLCIRQEPINDMQDAIFNQDIALHDLGHRAPGHDIRASAVRHER